jgi:hypothetical protein
MARPAISTAISVSNTRLNIFLGCDSRRSIIGKKAYLIANNKMIRKCLPGKTPCGSVWIGVLFAYLQLFVLRLTVCKKQALINNARSILGFVTLLCYKVPHLLNVFAVKCQL